MTKAMVIYHSQEYGNTGKVAELVARGIREVGEIDVEMINTNDAQRVDMETLAAADGVALGSPDYASYVAGTIKQVFDDMFVANRAGLTVRGKPCVLFMTHGGGGKGIEPFKSMARHMELVADPFVCRGAPEQGCEGAIELGRALGRAILG